MAWPRQRKRILGLATAKYSKDSRTDRTLEWKKDMDGLEKSCLELEQDQVMGFWSRAEDIISLSVSMPMTRRLRLPERAGWPRRRRQRFLGIYEPYVKDVT